jgi:hypothetical protein
LRGSPFERWDCPLGCGYYREWTETSGWLTTVIIHPLYGRISQGDLLIRDITFHTCRSFWMAYRRSPKGRMEVAAMRQVQENAKQKLPADGPARTRMVGGRKAAKPRSGSNLPMPALFSDSEVGIGPDNGLHTAAR